MIKPRTPSGVCELLPPQQLAFQRMLDAIRRGFERYGFLPIETPVFELAEVLLSKSGGETEKQVLRVGDDKVMRFDLTVPLARYVAEHEHELNFPFRRYQIQRVYRGERPQKGRYREFYQADIDVIGKDSLALSYDAELPAVVYGILRELRAPSFTIRVNNRKLLCGLLASLEIPETVLPEIDRGTLSRAEVEARLGLAPRRLARLLDTLTVDGDARAILDLLRRWDRPTPLMTEGLAELEQVYEGTIALGVPESAFRIDLSIARGLDYYTGTVYETFLNDHRGLGSICSGGRYDNLAGHYTKSKLPGVGISIGVTRLLSALTLVARSSVDVMVTRVEPGLAREYAALASELRAAGLNVETYGDDHKLAKQLKYANRAGVPLVLILGSREQAAGIVKIKTMGTGVESDVPRLDTAAAVWQLER